MELGSKGLGFAVCGLQHYYYKGELSFKVERAKGLLHLEDKRELRGVGDGVRIQRRAPDFESFKQGGIADDTEGVYPEENPADFKIPLWDL